MFIYFIMRHKYIVVLKFKLLWFFYLYIYLFISNALYFSHDYMSQSNWLEIEKKFLIEEKNLPKNLESYHFDEIEQWYLSITDDREERIRHRWDKYYHTIKIGTGQVRQEIEKEITKVEFDSLRAKANKIRLQKIRYLIPYKGHEIELDIYKWNLQWLIVAEIEFQSNDECENFEYPERFGKDVTNDIEFKNRNLALMKWEKFNMKI